MSSFQDLDETLYNNPAALSYMTEKACSTPTARSSSGILPQGCCERVSSKSWKDNKKCPICYFN